MLNLNNGKCKDENFVLKLLRTDEKMVKNKKETAVKQCLQDVNLIDYYNSHPCISNPFETMYELTLGQPYYKNKTYPQSVNNLSMGLTFDKDSFETEYRSSYKSYVTRHKYTTKLAQCQSPHVNVE